MNNEEHNKGIGICIIISLMSMIFVFALFRVFGFSYTTSIILSIGFSLIAFCLARLGYYLASKDEYDEMLERENAN